MLPLTDDWLYCLSKGIPYQKVKPIFHQNAKYLASGVGVGQCPRRQNFALPNAKYTNMLVYFALADANFLRYPTPTPRRQPPNANPPTPTLKFALAPTPTPDASQWNIGGVGPLALGLALGMYISCFFVLISFAFCSQRKPSFRWNMGLIVYVNYFGLEKLHL